MASVRRAVIDVGTNSVKLLVAEVDGTSVHPLFERNEQTRLGKGFYETHVLQPDAIARTARAIAEFRNAAASWEPQSICVIATSATRDAVNRDELIAAVKAESGLEMDVISGEQEADWAYSGVLSSPGLRGHPLLILDIGGGSTEFILGEGRVKHFRESFRLGTVRLMERFPVSDPPTPQEEAECREWISDFLDKQIRPALDTALAKVARSEVLMVGTGGTPPILGAIQLQLPTFDRDRLESLRLSRAEVQGLHERLWRLSLAERRRLPGLPENRADVILMGASIVEGVMREFGFDQLRISTRGMRFAALMDCES